MAGHSTLRSNTGSVAAAPAVEPPIPFKKPKSKGNKKGDDVEDAIHYRQYSVRLDPKSEDDMDKHNTYKKSVPTFETGTPEEWCEWRETIDDLLTSLQFTKADEHYNIYQSLFTGQALKEFMTFYKQECEEDQPPPAESTSSNEQTRERKLIEINNHKMENLQRALNQLALEYFANDPASARVQEALHALLTLNGSI